MDFHHQRLERGRGFGAYLAIAGHETRTLPISQVKQSERDVRAVLRQDVDAAIADLVHARRDRRLFSQPAEGPQPPLGDHAVGGLDDGIEDAADLAAFFANRADVKL